MPSTIVTHPVPPPTTADVNVFEYADVSRRGGAGEVDGVESAVLLHGRTDGDLIAGEIVKGVNRGMVCHGGHEAGDRIFIGCHVGVLGKSQPQGSQQEANLLIIQIDIPLRIAILDLHDGVIGIKILRGSGAHQIVPPCRDDRICGEHELLKGIALVGVVVKGRACQGNVLIGFIIELNISVGDESLCSLFARSVDRVDQNTLV